MKSIDEKKKLNKLLLCILTVLVCVVCLFTSSKDLGFILTYPFKYLFGDNFVLFFLLSATILLFKIFTQKHNFKLYKLYIWLLISILGFSILCSSSLIDFDNPLYQLNQIYHDIFNTVQNHTIIDYTFKNVPNNSGFLSILCAGILTKLFNNLGCIVCGSILMGLGLIMCILTIFIYYKKHKKTETINTNVEEIKSDEVKNKKETINEMENLFGESLINPNNYISTEETHVVKEERNENYMEDNAINKEIKTNNSKGTFNVFSDEIYSKKEEYVDNANKTRLKPFNVFTDKLFDDEIKKEETIEEVYHDNDVCVQDDKSSVDAINESSRNSNSINLNEFENSFNNNVKEKPIMEEVSKYSVKEKNEDEEKDDPLAFLNEVPSSYNNLTRDYSEKVDDTKQIYDYPLPPLSLLVDAPYNDNVENDRQAQICSIKLNSKLKSLGIDARVHDYKVAPSFTRFEIEFEENVKVGVINTIKSDLMMALSAEKINILAPIPGTNYAGVDIPNKNRSIVSFKECVIGAPTEEANNKLLLILGKDIVGNVITLPLNKAPHLLVAGTSGSGKSVCLNTLICSLITRAYPHEVSLILIDPKKVELSSYAMIPHLRCPVIIDVKQAIVALKKLEEEMANRNNIFLDNKVKNINGYNDKMKQLGKPTMDYIVIVIDEFQYLINESKQEVESHISNLCSMGRNAGIHVIVATQRPSVDIITGVIKGNINCRIAFSVPSNADSRTILDEVGAEELLGQGDMLFKSNMNFKLIRAQNLFIQDEEIENITNYLKEQACPNYDPNFMDLEEHDPEQMRLDDLMENDKNSDDVLFEKVVEYAKITPYISANLILKKYGVGSNRAARMIDKLEENGFVSPRDGTKPRQSYLYKLPKGDKEEDEEE